MKTHTLATAFIGFLLSGLTVATAAELEDDDRAPTEDPG